MNWILKFKTVTRMIDADNFRCSIFCSWVELMQYAIDFLKHFFRFERLVIINKYYSTKNLSIRIPQTI